MYTFRMLNINFLVAPLLYRLLLSLIFFDPITHHVFVLLVALTINIRIIDIGLTYSDSIIILFSLIIPYFEKKNNTCLLKQAVTHEMRSNVKYKHYMSLSELYFSIFDKPCVLDRTPFSEVKVMANCYFELKKHKNEC